MDMVRNQHNCDPALHEAPDGFEVMVCRRQIEAGGGFVKNQGMRRIDQRSSQ